MKPHFFSLLPQDLVSQANFEDESLSLAQANRVLAHLVGDGKLDFTLRHPIRKSMQQKLGDHFSLDLLKIIDQIEDPGDKSVRFLFEAQDKTLIEAVRIPLLKPGHFSLCLSSQGGCAMACDFCATGRLGFKRHLQTWEIISQFWQIREQTIGRISGVVFMGQGEPFHNYDAVIKAAQILSSPSGGRINSKNITISTVGLVPQIKRFTKEGHPYRLIISLTSAIQEKRAKLLPAASAWSVDELALAVRDYAEHGKELVTLAWVLIKGVNTGADEVKALKEHFDGMKCKINLIDVNDARPNGYERADESERKNFIGLLKELKVPIVRRYSVGNSRHSACGMLAGMRLSELSI